jgi:hypothetical protein
MDTSGNSATIEAKKMTLGVKIVIWSVERCTKVGVKIVTWSAERCDSMMLILYWMTN